jgi:hypothetical protein
MGGTATTAQLGTAITNEIGASRPHRSRSASTNPNG